MQKRLSAVVIVLAMVFVSFAAVSFTVPAEAVSGPFALKTDNWPQMGVDVIDQQQIDLYDVFQIDGYAYLTQSFQCMQGGVMPKVDLWIRYLSGTGYMNVAIYEWTGVPSAFITDTDVMYTELSGGGSWISVEFLSRPTLMAGMNYCIVLQQSGLNFDWAFAYPDPYPYGEGYYYNGGMFNIPNSGDYSFITYWEDTVDATLTEVAWAGDGNIALAVDGLTSSIYQFNRESGQWGNWGEMDMGSVFNDIVWSPNENMFFLAGQDDMGYAAAWGWHQVGGWYVYPPCVEGVFYGIEYTDAADWPYIFIAVGEANGDPNQALIASYDSSIPTWHVVGYASGSPYYDILYDITYDFGMPASYFIVGYEGDSGSGVVYHLSGPGTNVDDLGVIMSWSNYMPVLNAIDWRPYGSYGILVGDYLGAPGYGNILRLDNSWNQPTIINDDTSWFPNVDWFPDASKAVIVGHDGGIGRVLIHEANTYEVVDITSKLPTGTGALYGVACKGPTSPASAIILAAGGAVAFFPQAADTGTQIRVNAAFPHIFTIDMWDMATAVGLGGPSLLNSEVDVGGTYTFFIEANYTLGGAENWNMAGIELAAWYDNGATGAGSVPLDPFWSVDDRRTQQFKLNYNVGAGIATMDYPIGVVTEFSIDSWYEYPFGIDHHRVYINVTFGPQTYAADGNGFGFGFSPDILDISYLADANSWDFNYSAYDVTLPTAREEAYEEFGVKQAVSILANGNPSGNAPPGSSNVPLSPSSNVYYSVNSDYWVNASIPDLLLNGVGPNFISAANVDILNANYWNGTDSDISTWTAMPGLGNYVCVWGHSAPIVPLAPVLNGTQSAARVSDYTYQTYFNYPDWTTVQWRVTVPSIPEGVYWASITFTVESI